MASVLHIIIILILLSAMILVLLGIGELGNHELFDNEKETDELKKEINENPDVVSRTSIFNTLVNKQYINDEDPKNH